MYKYKFDESHIPWAKEQVWEARHNLDIYSELSEYELQQTAHHFPPAPAVVMDLGCGLGRSAISIYQYYNELASFADDIHFVLADRHGATENKGIMMPKTPEYYNDLMETTSFCKLNGMSNFQTFETEEDDWKKLPVLDFVSSRCACGFHFPISDYMPKLLTASAPDVTMIFGVNVKYSAESLVEFQGLFKESKLIIGSRDERFPVQNFLVLKGKKQF